MGKTSREDFAALMRRAGLELTAAQIGEMYAAWGQVEAMLARIRACAPAREAEPATIFKPVDFPDG